MSITTAIEALLHLVLAIILEDGLTVGFVVCAAATVKACVVVTAIVIALLFFDLSALFCLLLTLLFATRIVWSLLIFFSVRIPRRLFCVHTFETHAEHAILVTRELCTVVTIIHPSASNLQY